MLFSKVGGLSSPYFQQPGPLPLRLLILFKALDTLDQWWEGDDGVDEADWNYVHGDNFRPPPRRRDPNEVDYVSSQPPPDTRRPRRPRRSQQAPTINKDKQFTSLALPPSENNQEGARRRSNRRRLDVDSPRRRDRPPQPKPKYWKDRLTERVDYLLGLHQEDDELYRQWEKTEQEESASRANKGEGDRFAVLERNKVNRRWRQRNKREPIWEQKGSLSSLLLGRSGSLSSRSTFKVSK